jgi:hypothetical protein
MNQQFHQVAQSVLISYLKQLVRGYAIVNAVVRVPGVSVSIFCRLSDAGICFGCDVRYVVNL